MKIVIDPNSIDSYRDFLKIKSLPFYRFRGHEAEFPDEYASIVLGQSIPGGKRKKYRPPEWMWDYQGGVSEMAIAKKKYSLFIDCGYGKTAIFREFLRYAMSQLPKGKRGLIVSPLMVIEQTMAECEKFFSKEPPLTQIAARDLRGWMLGEGKGRLGITNYEALEDELPQGCLGCLVVDESSYLKSHYGKWGTTIINIGRGLEWKMAATGTPAPNDRIEYANHAVFMDAFPNVNSFLARFFVNRGQTQERWELRPHALEAFYRALSHWSIFMTNPATYGWKDNATNIPPINVHIHEIDLTQDQRDAVYAKTNRLFVDHVGGITKRATLGQIGKGFVDGKEIESLKPAFIRSLVDSWKGKSSIIWCHYNQEQDNMAKWFPDAANIDGSTPYEKRKELIGQFKRGEKKVLLTKPRILGFGQNLQIVTKMIFSTLQDSWEEYYQAVKRANRVGSTEPLDVHIPTTEVERPMVNNVLRKANMIQRDTAEQERIFKAHAVLAV